MSKVGAHVVKSTEKFTFAWVQLRLLCHLYLLGTGKMRNSAELTKAPQFHKTRISTVCLIAG